MTTAKDNFYNICLVYASLENLSNYRYVWLMSVQIVNILTVSRFVSCHVLSC